MATIAHMAGMASEGMSMTTTPARKTTPASDQTDLLTAIRASWDADAAAYDSYPYHGLHSAPERRAWQRALGEAFKPLGDTSSSRILDVGSGTGEIAVLLAGSGYQVTGVDLSPGMLAVARQKADRAGVPLTLLEGRADHLPLPDASCDGVFSRHLLWTLPDPDAALRDWVRVVRPGGIVALADGWWNEPAPLMRLRRAIGATLRRVLQPTGTTHHTHHGYAEIAPRLPLADGISATGARELLEGAGLIGIRVRDLAVVRAAERQGQPAWRWVEQARHTWLASGERPA